MTALNFDFKRKKWGPLVVQPEILTLRKIRKEDLQISQTNLGYRVKPCLETNNNNKKNKLGKTILNF